MFQRNHLNRPERSDRGPPQRRNVAETAELAAHVAGERPDIGALAAGGLEHGVVGIRDIDKFQPLDVHGPALQGDRLSVARQVIGALALDLDRRIARRDLLDPADKARADRGDGVARGPLRADFYHAAFRVVGIALLAPAHGEAIGLTAVDDERHGLGRLAERDRQATGGKRIERAGMAGALGREQPLDHGNRVRRGHADGLVEHDPAMHVALLAPGLMFPAALVLRGTRSARLEGCRRK